MGHSIRRRVEVVCLARCEITDLVVTDIRRCYDNLTEVAEHLAQPRNPKQTGTRGLEVNVDVPQRLEVDLVGVPVELAAGIGNGSAFSLPTSSTEKVTDITAKPAEA